MSKPFTEAQLPSVEFVWSCWAGITTLHPHHSRTPQFVVQIVNSILNEMKGIQRLFKKITNKGLEVTTKTRSSKSLLRSPKSTSYLAIWGQRKTPYFSWKLFCSTKTPASQEIELKLFKKEIFYTIGKDIPDILDKFDSVTNPPEVEFLVVSL